MTARIPLRLLVLLAPGLTLAGCISFVPKPPTSLMTLTPSEAPAVDQTVSTANASTIAILVPVTPAALATARVPVQTGPTSIAYVKEALWSEAPARLFARLLSDTVAARAGRVVLSPSQAVGSTGALLSGELRSFGIDEPSGQAVVVYEASLRRSADRVYEKRRFEARVPVARVDAATVGPALNVAANKVAAEVADWVGK